MREGRVAEALRRARRSAVTDLVIEGRQHDPATGDVSGETGTTPAVPPADESGRIEREAAETGGGTRLPALWRAWR